MDDTHQADKGILQEFPLKQKVLIIGPAWVGDMVMAQALFQVLAKADVEIHVLAPAWSLPLLQRMPEVTKSLLLTVSHGEFALLKRYRLAKTLRTVGYDSAFILPNSFKSALIPFWANISHRCGYLREGRGILLTDGRKLHKAQYPLMIERFLALAYPSNTTLEKPYPLPRLSICQHALEQAIQKYQLKLNGSPITVLCPGAEFGPAKRWPLQHYASVALSLLAKGHQIWLLGSKQDSVITAEINAKTKYQCQDFAGKTTLGEAIDLMSLSSFVVTNDSGLMHIAAALRKPLVAIYGSSDPSFTPPLAKQVKIVREALPCSPCFKRICPLKHMACLETLYPEKVLAALEALTMIAV